jgi:hypothetical protein
MKCEALMSTSLFSFGFCLKSAVVAVICEPSNGHLHFVPWFKLCFSQNKERYHSLLTYHHLSYLLDDSANFHFLLQGVSLKAVIEVVSICGCVGVTLSRQGPRVPPFSTSKFFLQENIFLDCTACLVLDSRSGNIWWVHHLEILADLCPFQFSWPFSTIHSFRIQRTFTVLCPITHAKNTRFVRSWRVVSILGEYFGAAHFVLYIVMQSR